MSGVIYLLQRNTKPDNSILPTILHKIMTEDG